MSAPLCLMSSYCMAGHTGGGGWHEQARLASRCPLLCEARIFQLWAVTRRGEAAGRSRLVGSQARMPQSFWLSRINRTQGSHAPEDRLDPTEALDKALEESRGNPRPQNDTFMWTANFNPAFRQRPHLLTQLPGIIVETSGTSLQHRGGMCIQVT